MTESPPHKYGWIVSTDYSDDIKLTATQFSTQGNDGNTLVFLDETGVIAMFSSWLSIRRQDRIEQKNRVISYEPH